MKLSIRAIALTMGLLWAGAMLVVGLINMVEPAYGMAFLQMMSSVYPGFHDSRTWMSVAIGTIYGFIDGAVGGLIFAWIYDAIAGSRHIDHTA